jgi:hypothetical protein
LLLSNPQRTQFFADYAADLMQVVFTDILWCNLAILAFNFCKFLLNFVLCLNCFCSFASFSFKVLNALIGSKYSPLDNVANRTIP